MTRNEVFQLIEDERLYQNGRWGTKFDYSNTPNDWVAYIAKYLGQTVTLPWNVATFRDQMVKVAALAVAVLEQETYAPRHYDKPDSSGRLA